MASQEAGNCRRHQPSLHFTIFPPKLRIFSIWVEDLIQRRRRSSSSSFSCPNWRRRRRRRGKNLPCPLEKGYTCNYRARCFFFFSCCWRPISSSLVDFSDSVSLFSLLFSSQRERERETIINIYVLLFLSLTTITPPPPLQQRVILPSWSQQQQQQEEMQLTFSFSYQESGSVV